MPYQVCVEDSFHACHAIRMPNGEMEQFHWHRWGVEAVFGGAELDDAGVLVDFIVVTRRLREILDPLEGANLNGHAFLQGAPSSTEIVARRIFEALAAGPRARAPSTASTGRDPGAGSAGRAAAGAIVSGPAGPFGPGWGAARLLRVVVREAAGCRAVFEANSGPAAGPPPAHT